MTRPKGTYKIKTIQDILLRTKPEGDCRIWQYAQHAQGYGMMRQAGKMRTVHSVVAELKYGYAPDKYNGERVSRTCGNPLCVAPEHVVIVSASSINANKTFQKGRFTDDQIRAIRAEYDSYINKYGVVKQLAEDYNCSVALMSSVCRRWIYKRVKDES